MNKKFKIGDLVYVEGAGVPKRNPGPAWAVNDKDLSTHLAVILKIHTKASPHEVFYKIHFMEKDKEDWISGTYLHPTD
tara:strand:+ start:4541 stop:4774 length:234 start_codon:yes stop_codon:yes gene_type:complete